MLLDKSQRAPCCTSLPKAPLAFQAPFILFLIHQSQAGTALVLHCIYIYYSFGLLSASKVKRFYQQRGLRLPNPAVSHPQKHFCGLSLFISLEPSWSLCLSSTPGFSLQLASLQEASFPTSSDWAIFPIPSKSLPERCSV